MAPRHALRTMATSNTGDPTSYAYQTARTRWPSVIALTQQDVESTTQSSSRSADDVEVGKEIARKLSQLKDEILSDRPLEPLVDDGGPDVADYNAGLEELGPLTWLASPWLFSECYMYRLIHTFFTTSGSQFWQSYDVYRAMKMDAFTGSKAATIQLLGWHMRTLSTLDHDEDIEKALFDENLQISLWGNATDLSLLTSYSVEDLQSRQSKESRQAAKRNIVADDTEQVWELLRQTRSTGPVDRLDIVLDNAGFELLTDMVLAAFLLRAGYTKHLVLHGKRMPWFISDVNVQDLEDLLQSLEQGRPGSSHEEQQLLQSVGRVWRNLVDEGRLELRIDPFWTTHWSFCEMPEAAPGLFRDLAKAHLVIFKGDLNYRKLTSDGMWPRTTPFRTALGILGEVQGDQGLRILALRTCKADVCVGLAPGLEEQLEQETRGEWTRNGLYAVASYWDGKGPISSRGTE